MKNDKHGGEIYNKSIRIDFSSNINPLGMPEAVKQALVTSVKQYEIYPDTECQNLRKSIALKEKISKEHILCGNGASELIFRFCTAYKPKQALLLAPSFSEYEKALVSNNCFIHYHLLKEEEDFCLTERILTDLQPNIDVVFLCNPNNPIGNIFTKNLFKKILKKCVEKRIFIVIDECFLDFTENYLQLTVVPFIKDFNNILVLKAFTKMYAMAGLRLGYAMLNNPILYQKMILNGPSWSVSTPARIAGEIALQETDYVEKTRKYIQKEQKFLTQGLKKRGFYVYQTAANFIFFKGEIGLYQKLLPYGILIRLCDNYKGLSNTFYRIAVKKRSENQQFLYYLDKCQKEES